MWKTIKDRLAHRKIMKDTEPYLVPAAVRVDRKRKKQKKNWKTIKKIAVGVIITVIGGVATAIIVGIFPGFINLENSSVPEINSSDTTDRLPPQQETNEEMNKRSERGEFFRGRIKQIEGYDLEIDRDRGFEILYNQTSAENFMSLSLEIIGKISLGIYQDPLYKDLAVKAALNGCIDVSNDAIDKMALGIEKDEARDMVGDALNKKIGENPPECKG